MSLTKAQLAILAEMARTGEPLVYAGGPCLVGEKTTTVPLRRALLAAGMVRPSRELARCAFNIPLVLTDAGRAEGERELANRGIPPHGWVRFHDVAIQRCRMMSQYASRYIDGRNGQPNLGAGLRFRGRVQDYHRILIHADDVEEWVRRWQANEEQGR